jgi:hypothetical protein
VECLYSLNIMSREKKSQVDDLTKLRRILDNSSDSNIDALFSENEKALTSVRRRLRGAPLKTQLQPDRFSRTIHSLEPRVYVHPKTTVAPRLTIPVQKSKPPVVLPEFELVSTSIPIKTIPSPEVTFTSEDLFEVEKIETILPEFLEITPKETTQKPLETIQTTRNEEIPISESDLPEWQPIKDEPGREPLKSHRTPKIDDIPEFERVRASTKPEVLEKPVTSEMNPAKEVSIETPVVFIPVESSEPSFQKFSHKQNREEKIAQRKKEREAKRRKKIELKKLKKEKREKKHPENQITNEHHPLQQPRDEMSSVSRYIDAVDTPQIPIDIVAFKDIKSIDEITAEILYKNGYFSIENLKDATVDDLVEIRGIKRKLAKQIKKEIEQKMTITEDVEFVPIKQKTTKKKLKKNLDDSTEWESFPSKETINKSSSISVFTYKEYTLYTRETSNPAGKKTAVHFFSKEKPEMSAPAQLPEGYQISVNKKTGIPYLKKKR